MDDVEEVEVVKASSVGAEGEEKHDGVDD